MKNLIIELGLASEVTKGSLGNYIEISITTGTLCHPNFSIDENGVAQCDG